MGRRAITESMVREAMGRGDKKLEIPRDAVVTAAAEDLANARGVVLIRMDVQAVTPTAGAVTNPVRGLPDRSGPVVIGSDHGGFQLKVTLAAHVSALGYTVLDAGTKDETPCDYPDYAFTVAQMVADGKAWRGIMIDGAGIGSCMAVNKVPGVRGACCHNEFTARNACEHNNANVLTLGSRVLGVEVCKAIVKVFLETPFAGGGTRRGSPRSRTSRSDLEVRPNPNRVMIAASAPRRTFAFQEVKILQTTFVLKSTRSEYHENSYSFWT